MAIELDKVSLGEEHPLSEFLDNPQAYLQRLHASRSPEVLTVAGEEQVVVQDAKAYRELLGRVDLLDTIRILQSELESIRDGVPGIPAEEVFREMRKVLNLPEGDAGDEV